MDDAHAAGLRAYYERGEERDRLDSGHGQLEFARTAEIVLRHLPSALARVADIGGGPGRYALWLAGLGYRVEHRDLVPLHVRQVKEAVAAGGTTGLHTAVGDARELDLADASVDAVLLLGPLYHLERRADRVRALGEARRVVRPGGPVFAAAISRWAPRADGVLRQRLHQAYPEVLARIGEVERTGIMRPVHPGSFCGFCHRPGQLRGELRAAGLTAAGLVGVEGPGWLLGDLAERMADAAGRTVVLQTVERVPELLGLSTHLLATGIRPAGQD
jgi:SAM-dependent methyltransferase